MLTKFEPESEYLREIVRALISHNWWPKKRITQWTADDITIVKLLLRIEGCTDDGAEIFEQWIKNDTVKDIDAGYYDIPRIPHDTKHDELINMLTDMLNKGEKVL
jgi:hypothetical protein